MNEQQFEELWDRAEARRYASSLAAGYPAWRTRRRRTAGVVAGLAMAAVLSFPVLMPHKGMDSVYAKVYCNRTGTDDMHWVGLADELLLAGLK